MATRSRIAVERTDGCIDSIYCHWDGYPEHVGLLLESYYNNLKQINKLLELGDLSSLGKRIKPISSKHSFDEPEEDTTVAYKRDRGEENTDMKHHTDYGEFKRSCLESDQNYAYLYKDKKWYCAMIPYVESELNFKPLKEVLKELNIKIEGDGKEL